MNFYSLLLVFLTLVHCEDKSELVSLKSKEIIRQPCQEKTKVVLEFAIKNGFHIQLNNTQEDNLIASEVIVDQDVSAITFFGRHERILLGGNEMEVFSDELRVELEMSTSSYLSADAISGYLFYQACDNFKCYFPRKLVF